MTETGSGSSQPTREHFAVDISVLDKSLAKSVQKKLDDVSPSPFSEHCCIYKVHEKFLKINKYAYTPEMVSIGPFHRKQSFEDMEKQKLRYVKTLLSRTGTKLEECLASIRSVEDKARKSYSEPIDNLDTNEFIEMMVIDGLFIIDLFQKSAKDVTVDRDDPIFNNKWRMASLVRDMILLENQIPMLVLSSLFKIVKRNQKQRQSQNQNQNQIQNHNQNQNHNQIQNQNQNQNQRNRTLAELALLFFNPLMKRDEEILKSYFREESKHLLDLFGKTFHKFGQDQGSNPNMEVNHIRCVTELREAGVTFKKNANATSFLDIKFKDGVFEIPPLLIQDQTGTLFRNLIAFEQCCHGKSTYMTSYAYLMDSLINSENDVEFLGKQGIITNCLGDDKDVSSLFNKLCSEVTLVNFYYHDLCNRVNLYTQTCWPTWRATLMHDYFNKPWAIFSVAAAIMLLLLTTAATTFAILSFAVHKS